MEQLLPLPPAEGFGAIKKQAIYLGTNLVRFVELKAWEGGGQVRKGLTVPGSSLPLSPARSKERIVPGPVILWTLGWRGMKGCLGSLCGKAPWRRQRRRIQRVMLWVSSYSTKTCYARSNPRCQAGTRTSGFLGCLVRVLRTVMPLSALQGQIKGPFWWGVGVMRGEGEQQGKSPSQEVPYEQGPEV